MERRYSLKLYPILISVVIPTYNRKALLERALKSVWAQDYADMEIIVVDDGSCDGTHEYLSEIQYKDPRILPVFHEKNKGEAAARNTGVKAAQGKYIAFLDSDDEWLPGKIKAQVELMEASDASVGACCTGQYYVDIDGNLDKVCDWSDTYKITDRNLLIRGCGVGMGNTFIIRRTVFADVGYYDIDLPLLVDLDWLCRLTRRYKIIKIFKPYIRYNKSPIRHAALMEIAVKKFVEKNRGFIETFGLFEKMAITSRFYNYISISYYEHGPWWKYIKSQFGFLLYNPRQPLKQYVFIFAVLLGLRKIGVNKNN